MDTVILAPTLRQTISNHLKCYNMGTRIILRNIKIATYILRNIKKSVWNNDYIMDSIHNHQLSMALISSETTDKSIRVASCYILLLIVGSPVLRDLTDMMNISQFKDAIIFMLHWDSCWLSSFWFLSSRYLYCGFYSTSAIQTTQLGW